MFQCRLPPVSPWLQSEFGWTFPENRYENIYERKKEKYFVAKTYETGGIVISNSLGIPECFQYRIGLDNLVFKISLKNIM